jgi:hypothetical protein
LRALFIIMRHLEHRSALTAIHGAIAKKKFTHAGTSSNCIKRSKRRWHPLRVTASNAPCDNGL